MDIMPVRRALISVSDKTGIVELCQAMCRNYSIEIISTGGTAAALKLAGITVKDISEVTGFDEMMDGRVKTLHPLVHGGLLAVRDNPEHQTAMRRHGIVPIDLLIVNLYPFEAATARPECTFDHAIENIDIGGPAMIRSAAKNHQSVAVVTDPNQYPELLSQMKMHGGCTNYAFRRELAAQAFLQTAAYDAMIHGYFSSLPKVTSELTSSTDVTNSGEFPTVLVPVFKKLQPLRYGENPHQKAAFYSTGRRKMGIASAQQLHGKQLSYINILDADAAMNLVKEFSAPAAAVIKHANPCGCGIGNSLSEAFERAYAGDPVAAFGGIVALNREVDGVTAKKIIGGKRFLEVLIAPGFSDDALDILKLRWVDCRILAAVSAVQSTERMELRYQSVSGGVLVQSMDDAGFSQQTCQVVSKRSPTSEEWMDMEFVWLLSKHVKSNAIAIARDGQLLGSGAGQMSRVTSCRLAVELARQNSHGEKLRGSAAASDAFFPFDDGPRILIEAGVTAMIEPGGSKRDQETIDLCNQHGITLVLTGVRHFRH